jgi:PPOX class probable F420-dependent enzyme
VAFERLPAWAQEMLRTARVGRLGLLDDRDRPRVLPVTFALVGEAIYTAIDNKPKVSREPARVRYLKRRPEAALTVDRYDDDWTELAWVQVLGRVELLDTAAAPTAMEALAAKYEPYRREAPPGPLLKLVPERALHWRASN